MNLLASIPAKPAALLRAVAPIDLADQSVYIIPAHMVEENKMLDSEVCGWTYPDMDLEHRGLLERCGHWRGRGFATVLRITSFNLLLHEFAHWLDGYSNHPGKPWGQHGDRFIRACSHLAWRARQNGQQIHFHDVIKTDAYGLSHPSHYSQTLGNEPRAMADLPIRQILDSPPPDAFAQLWASDTQECA